jgi:TP901-1 family phage major tail protein
MAQTTGIMNGTLTKINVDATDVAYLTSNDINFEMATRDASNKDSGGNREILEGQKSVSVSGEGFFAEDATFGFEDLYDKFTARSPVTVLYTNSNVGDVEYSFSAYITSLSRSDANEESVTFSITLEGTGAVTKQVIS